MRLCMLACLQEFKRAKFIGEQTLRLHQNAIKLDFLGLEWKSFWSALPYRALHFLDESSFNIFAMEVPDYVQIKCTSFQNFFCESGTSRAVLVLFPRLWPYRWGPSSSQSPSPQHFWSYDLFLLVEW